jgi:hypothetical protein
MTENEWLICRECIAEDDEFNHFNTMLVCPKLRTSYRKLLLFAVACCRRIWHICPNGRWRDALLLAESCETQLPSVETVNEIADFGGTGRSQASTKWECACLGAIQSLFSLIANEQRYKETPWYSQALIGLPSLVAEQVAIASHYRGRPQFGRNAPEEWDPAETAVQCDLIRDIFGNPFRPVAFDPRWRTADVTTLARGIYEDRAFERLPLLADALMDAGCDSEDVLTHCRSDGPHVRGCWVVDLVLGKE